MSTAPLTQLSQTAQPVSDAGLDAFLAEPGWGLLLVAGDPAQRPEAQDLAVVVRELSRRGPPGLRVGLAALAEEARFKQRLGLDAVPSLVFVRGGKVVSKLSKVQDWAVYQRAADVLWGRERGVA